MIEANRPDAGDVALDSLDPDRRRVVIDALTTVSEATPRPAVLTPLETTSSA